MSGMRSPLMMAVFLGLGFLLGWSGSHLFQPAGKTCVQVRGEPFCIVQVD